MKRLPIVKVPYRQPNPSWVSVKDEYGYCVNMEDYYLPEAMVEAEVLTLNLGTNTMRVRLLEPQPSHSSKSGFQKLTLDVSNEYFFNAFDIVGKGI